MRARLLAPHFVRTRYWERGEELDFELATPLMVGLDPDAIAAIGAEKHRVFDRLIWDADRMLWVLQDDPPIEFVMDNSPVHLLVTAGGPPGR